MPEAGGGTDGWSARPRAGGMRETAMAADHESDDALREGAGEWRWGSMAVVGWSEAMASGMGKVGKWGFRPSYPVCSRLRSFLVEPCFPSVKIRIKSLDFYGYDIIKVGTYNSLKKLSFYRCHYSKLFYHLYHFLYI